MKAINITFILLVFILFSCKKAEKDKTFKIYHLTPNSIAVNTDTLRSNGWYSTTREDFFVVKNYDINNEQHKIKIDSFVVYQLKKDDFLATNKNASWSMKFFNYGNGIDENTKHEYGTDYTIHNLFSYKKEIANFHFNNRVGYSSCNYIIEPKILNTNKRKIVLDYFNSIDTLNPDLVKMMQATLHYLGQDGPNIPTVQKDTIQVLANFIYNDYNSSSKTAQYKVLKSMPESAAIKEDTINVLYSDTYQPETSTSDNTLTLLRYKLKFNTKYHYVFLDDDDVRLIIAAE
ncbi:MAG: hypothetical protein R2753_15625 [Chitinophagales bacterium]